MSLLHTDVPISIIHNSFNSANKMPSPPVFGSGVVESVETAVLAVVAGAYFLVHYDLGGS